MICDVIFNYGRFLIIISTQEVSQLMKLLILGTFCPQPNFNFQFCPKDLWKQTKMAKTRIPKLLKYNIHYTIIYDWEKSESCAEIRVWFWAARTQNNLQEDRNGLTATKQGRTKRS